MNSLLEQIRKGKLWDFHGGIHPEEHKQLSSQTSLLEAGLPPLLVLPLKQHIGSPAELCVQVGDRVLTGQPLTAPSSPMQVPIHASSSGTVVAIEEHTVAHPSGLSEPCILIQTDGQDSWRPRDPWPDYAERGNDELLARIHQAGIAGLGGAGFPTDIKLKGAQAYAQREPLPLLIVNGCECEPYITADDRLMRDEAAAIVEGITLLQQILRPQLTLIAIEDNKPEAIAAIRAQVKNAHTLVKVLPTKYPSGGERQLIEILTGRQVPSGKPPSEMGILVQNVGTLYAIRQAVVEDEPLIRRVVTLTGDRLAQPGNAWVRLGTSVRWLMQRFGLDPEPGQRVIMGGPMMGFTLPHADVPVVKTSNCLLAPSQRSLPSRDEEINCIRCGQCAEACPASLLPQQLYWYSKAGELDTAEQYRLFDCIECGACAWVCPSNIPLVQYYRQAKSQLRNQRQEQAQAERAKQRFADKQQRLEEERLERDRRMQAANEARRAQLKDAGGEDPVAAALARIKAKQAAQAVPTVAEDPIAAAVARAKAKKAAREAEAPEVTPAATADDALANPEASPASEAPAADPRQAAVAAAIARAKAKKAAREADAPEVTPAATTDDAPANPEASPASEAPAADPRQAAVAAAIARAKAKKAAREADAPEVTPAATADDAPANPEASPAAEAPAADPRQAAVTAAIARAKAKKAAREAAADNSAPPVPPSSKESD
ncbi:electron transport complex subunit RsxC [Pseudaeromonas paramecii]|uniref:Ion-translocating oxidoreductase complex subunit C n=1 Tax=Pseudaeromonas paramecii TaxID=2138166 RepID=A0ABP8QF39_9GAMM